MAAKGALRRPTDDHRAAVQVEGALFKSLEHKGCRAYRLDMQRPIDDVPGILDEIEIDDLQVLRQLANTMRARLLFHFRQPRSVADVAARMRVPVTRLYYHVNMLEEAGVITVVGTRKRGPQLEKVYRITAHEIRPAPGILSRSGADAEEFAMVAAGLVLDSARAELVDSLARHARAGFDPEEIAGELGRTIVSLPESVAAEFVARLRDLVMELKDHDDDGGRLYSFAYAFFALDPPGEDD